MFRIGSAPRPHLARRETRVMRFAPGRSCSAIVRHGRSPSPSHLSCVALSFCVRCTPQRCRGGLLLLRWRCLPELLSFAMRSLMVSSFVVVILYLQRGACLLVLLVSLCRRFSGCAYDCAGGSQGRSSMSCWRRCGAYCVSNRFALHPHLARRGSYVFRLLRCLPRLRLLYTAMLSRRPPTFLLYSARPPLVLPELTPLAGVVKPALSSLLLAFSFFSGHSVGSSAGAPTTVPVVVRGGGGVENEVVWRLFGGPWRKGGLCWRMGRSNSFPSPLFPLALRIASTAPTPLHPCLPPPMPLVGPAA